MEVDVSKCSMSRVAALSLLAFLSAAVRAEVKLPFLFSDGMVLQRNAPVRVWGDAAPGEKVAVEFRGEVKAASASSLGHWEVFFTPKSEGGPFELTVKATNKITVRDVLVGDVWVASGQSNMELPLLRSDNGKEVIKNASNKYIRVFRVSKFGSEYPLNDGKADAQWSVISSESTPELSAVAYYFALEIEAKEHVPVGVISSLWGGTVIESWISLEALASDSSLSPIFAARAQMMRTRDDDARIDNKEKALKEEARVAGKPEPSFPWRPYPAMWAPAQLFNAMIAPISRYTIKGVIWYQGESNSQKMRAPGYEKLYERMLPLMIRDWREHWGQGDFPFVYVQLPNFKSWDGEDWPTIREAQRKALSIRNAAMVETIDLGNPDDVHPTNKQPVGHRLALAARNLAYSEKVEWSGPLYRQVTREDGALRVWFDHAEGLKSNSKDVLGFEIAGDDGVYYSAIAKIEGSTILVSSDKVKDPVAVRYGWANNPTVNVVNADGLPASPFSSK